jgi:hypothetical protein
MYSRFSAAGQEAAGEIMGDGVHGLHELWGLLYAVHS